MNDTDSRQFIPPPLFQQVCNFAVREVMCHGIGEVGEFDYTVSDCLAVSMLYPKNPTSFRLPTGSSVSLLYNSFADLQDRIRERNTFSGSENVSHP